MNTRNPRHNNRPCILVEGPSWGDAEFYGQWLLCAAKANELLHRANKDDAEFRTAVYTLEIMQCLDFGIVATVFLAQFADKQFDTFVIDVDYSGAPFGLCPDD